jgi:hypothetical protein
VHDLDPAHDVRVELGQLLAGTHSSRIVPPPARWTGQRQRNSASTSKRVTEPAPSCLAFQSRAMRTA